MNDVIPPPSRALVPAAPWAGRPTSFADVEKLAKWFAESVSVPKQYQGRVADCFVAIQMGVELGLAPMQALQNIAVIGGRPAVFGDAMLGLCLQSPHCKDVVERFEGDGQDMVAICTAVRAGASTPVERRFSVADAMQAALWGKDGPWTFYPKRMLQLRARAFALRDAFPDVLRGLASAEEATDSFAGPTIDGTAEPGPVDPPKPPPAPPAGAAAPDAGKTPPPPAQEGRTEGNGNGGNGKRPTGRQWLDALRMALVDAKSANEIQAILGRDDVKAAQEKMTGDQLGQLNRLIASAQFRFAPAESQPSAEEQALIAEIAAMDIDTLDAQPTTPEFNRRLMSLDFPAQDRVSAALKARAEQLQAAAGQPT